MATKLADLELEIAHFNSFRKHIPKLRTLCQHTIDEMLSMGLVQSSTGFEIALANKGNHEHVSEDCGDLYKNGTYSEAKLASVRTSSYGTSYSAPITNLKNKTGKLRCQVYERKQQKFYYFIIPYTVYKNIPRTSNIEIPFELDGTPRKISKRKPKYANWWKYQVTTFKELSNG